MARGLVRAGHQVTMLCEVPNHPTGIIQPGYRGKLWVRETLDGIEVIRVWVRTTPVKTFHSRMAFYLSYMAMATWAGLFLARGRYDAIYCTSPPLFVGGAGLMLSKSRRIPLIFEVRDLWPETAVTLGELRNPRFVRWATRLEEACYQRAQHIVTTSQESANRLIERGQPPETVSVIRNGANVELFRPNRAAGEQIRSELGLTDKFLLLYAGLHGLIYDLEGLIDVAASLQEYPDIHFLLVGDGPTKTSVQKRVEVMGITNVTLLPAQPRELIPDYFNAADVSLAPLKEPHVVGSFPTKVYDSMACQVPVIASDTGETQIVIDEAKAGIVTPPGNPAALRAAILTMRADPVLRACLGRNGRQSVTTHYSRQAQASQLEKLLRSIVDDQGNKPTANISPY
jgi:glycosyltransferase involved in cell wall biosynthesis